MQYDVLICGAGIAGLTLARQIRQNGPDASIALIDPVARPLPEACHKVGESTVELAAHYLATVLDLDEYLRTEHIIKNGLRFFPGGGADRPIEGRTEIGPPELPIVPSFQLDRGRFENDLRAMNEADGIKLYEGSKVTEIQLRPDQQTHRVEMINGEGSPSFLEGRWVVDASGRRQLLSRKLGLRTSTSHDARAAWFRVANRVDVAELVPNSDTTWHGRDPQHIRWQSTVHFMGEGYWVWLIPLSTGYTSVGVVVDASIHAFETIRTEDKLREWLAKHEPVLADRLKAEQAEDFLCYRDYSYCAKRVFSSDRWAIVGEAGTFVDPFYSPGSDYIAVANCYAERMIREDLQTGDSAIADTFSEWYLRIFDEAVVTFRHMMPCFGNTKVMTAKIYWDNLQYWSFICQFFIQRGYALPLEQQELLLQEGAKFGTRHKNAQALFRKWHELTRDDALGEARTVMLPPIPSILANAYLDLQNRVEPEALLAMLQDKRAVTEQVLTELVVRVLRDLPVDAGAELIRELDIASWNLPFDGKRLALEDASPRDRRRGLSPISKDVERCLGKPRKRDDVASWDQLFRERLALTTGTLSRPPST